MTVAGGHKWASNKYGMHQPVHDISMATQKDSKLKGMSKAASEKVRQQRDSALERARAANAAAGKISNKPNSAAFPTMAAQLPKKKGGGGSKGGGGGKKSSLDGMLGDLASSTATSQWKKAAAPKPKLRGTFREGGGSGASAQSSALRVLAGGSASTAPKSSTWGVPAPAPAAKAPKTGKMNLKDFMS